MPPAKKEAEKKDENPGSAEAKGIASRIIGPFKPVRYSAVVRRAGALSLSC